MTLDTARQLLAALKAERHERLATLDDYRSRLGRAKALMDGEPNPVKRQEYADRYAKLREELNADAATRHSAFRQTVYEAAQAINATLAAGRPNASTDDPAVRPYLDLAEHHDLGTAIEAARQDGNRPALAALRAGAGARVRRSLRPGTDASGAVAMVTESLNAAERSLAADGSPEAVAWALRDTLTAELTIGDAWAGVVDAELRGANEEATARLIEVGILVDRLDGPPEHAGGPPSVTVQDASMGTTFTWATPETAGGRR